MRSHKTSKYAEGRHKHDLRKRKQLAEQSVARHKRQADMSLKGRPFAQKLSNGFMRGIGSLSTSRFSGLLSQLTERKRTQDKRKRTPIRGIDPPRKTDTKLVGPSLGVQYGSRPKFTSFRGVNSEEKRVEQPKLSLSSGQLSNPSSSGYRNSAPVSLGHSNVNTYFSDSMHNGKYRLKGCNRVLPGGLLLNGPTAKHPNTAGQLLYEVSISPNSLGDQVRRPASIFEVFKVHSIRVFFIAARPTSTPGTLFAWFDRDPVDRYTDGLATLIEAAAHTGASGTSVWESKSWVMPKDVRSGEKFVERAGFSPSDLRFQSQGTFRIALDTPIDSSLIFANYNLGSVFVEYDVEFSKPTLQPNFVGTASNWYQEVTSTIVPAAVTLNNAAVLVFDSLGDTTLSASNIRPFIPDVRNNDGSEMRTIGTSRTLCYGPGVYNQSVQVNGYTTNGSATAYSAINLEYLDDNGNVTSVTQYLQDSKGDPGPSTTYARVTNSVSNYMSWYWPNTISVIDWAFGWRLVVPDGQKFNIRLKLVGNSIAETAIGYFQRLRFSSTIAWPTQEEQEQLQPQSVDLLSRIKDIEEFMRKETKSEDPVEDCKRPFSGSYEAHEDDDESKFHVRGTVQSDVLERKSGSTVNMSPSVVDEQHRQTRLQVTTKLEGGPRPGTDSSESKEEKTPRGYIRLKRHPDFPRGDLSRLGLGRNVSDFHELLDAISEGRSGTAVEDLSSDPPTPPEIKPKSKSLK